MISSSWNTDTTIDHIIFNNKTKCEKAATQIMNEYSTIKNAQVMTMCVKQ